MSLRSEAEQLERLRALFAGAVAEGALGLVDDAATLPTPAPGATRVICADQVIEGRHFVIGKGTPADAGWRAVVRNVSDVAAMGATPVGFVWTLAVPRAWFDDDGAVFVSFVAGAAEAARAFNCPLYGGDLGVTDGPMVASVTAFGDVAGGAPLLRTGARPGDGVFVSRPLGASAAGLSRLLAGDDPSALPPVWAAAHLRPTPEHTLGPALVGRASACMDVSDGLLLDLSRLTRASGVGAVLEQPEAAIDPSIAGDPRARDWALSGGEDYALVFTTAAVVEDGAIRVGTILEEPGLFERRDGALSPLAAEGFDHLR